MSRPGDDCDEDHDDKNYEDDYDDDGDNDDGGDDYEDDEDDGGGGVQNKSLHTKSQTIFFGRLIITIDSKNYLGFNDHIKKSILVILTPRIVRFMSNYYYCLKVNILFLFMSSLMQSIRLYGINPLTFSIVTFSYDKTQCAF